MTSIKNYSYQFLLLFLAACSLAGQHKQDGIEGEPKESAPLYIQMADSELKRTPDPRLLDFRSKPKWEYTNGLVCSAFVKVYEETGDESYLDYAKYYLDSMINEDGSIKTYKQSDYNIDRVNSGKVLMEVYKLDPQPKYQKAIELLRAQMKDHPRTSEGGFWHKKRYPYQMWLDGLYMGSPFLAQYAAEFNEPALYDEVAHQIYLIDKYAYDSTKKLYYHGWDESREQKWSDPETGVSPNFWGRAMGWFAMALVDVLDYMPQDHPKRDEVIAILDKLVVGLMDYQDESGLWWQVLDEGGREGNYLETSCTSMFAYSILKGVQKGYLDEKNLINGMKAYEGMVDQFIKENEDGTITLQNVCGVAGLGGDPYRDASYEYYVGEEIRDNDPKGVGPFIMASLIYNDLKSSQ
ncbi:glycoside hydrolase family 88/105 protein [Reichenbachiella ulvae]|uniref:Glycoside hydrolase family 88 protein n=1 Tax=Reichenbachiella ulvae TaxID=2980104 RepID=A0ABT3CNT7_9BACT|nr:glycoside hydrolase family 88 protein [Reichenbachiella ulvae]MCV9385398.1 glycoside hydrolase family 88 protein [Reichenbachiella ulvae]